MQGHGGPCLRGCAGGWATLGAGGAGGRWACGTGVRVGLVWGLFWPGSRWWSRRAAPPRPSGHCRCPALAPRARPVPVPDPARGHADELGAVPGLMYHQLLARPAGDYDQAPAQFRDQLEQLYAHHFRPVTDAALAAGRVGLPAGTSPMVLTFDDSTVSQYPERPDGTVAPDCAVGILLSVAHTYGQDRPVASFYVNAHPFAGRDGYLRRVSALGMELGDHTATHADLWRLGAAGVQRELAHGLAVITQAVPGASVTTMALPYGVQPRDGALAHASTFAGISYDFRAVLLVEADPAKSPYASGFDPEALPGSAPGDAQVCRCSPRRTGYPGCSAGSSGPTSATATRLTSASPRPRPTGWTPDSRPGPGPTERQRFSERWTGVLLASGSDVGLRRGR